MSSKFSGQDLMHKIQNLEGEQSQLEILTEHVKIIYDNSLDMIGLGNLEGYFTEINPAFERILGYSKKEFLGKPFLDFVYEEDFEVTKDALIAAASGKEEIGITNRYRCKDGSVKWVDWRVQCVVTENQFVAVGRDITEQKKYEQELRKESDFSKLLLDTAQSIILVLNPDGTINSFNPYMEEVSGYTLEEVQGKDWFETFLPNQDWQSIRRLFKKAINDMEIRGNVNPIVTKDGRELSIDWYAKTLKDDTGRTLGLLSIGHDITDRIQTEKIIRQSETRLQLALEAADIAIWDWDVQKGETYFSPNYFTMLGYQCDELPSTYETWNALLHDEDRESAVEEVKRYLAKGTGWDIEFRLKTKQGDYKWIRGKGNVVEKDTDGTPLRATGTHLDISGQKCAEDDRLKLQKLESTGILAGGIAHDFNNILAAILGNVNLALLDSQLNPETQKLLEEAEKASLRAKSLTQQLLTFSKGGEPIKETASLKEVVQDSTEFVLHGEKSVSKFEIPGDLWLVDIDKGQISQVVQNIILNANQAMPDGGTIEIRCENHIQSESASTIALKAGNYIKLTIKDCGAGIPANMIGRIFDPYFSTKQKGSGLGLAITHSIIKKHDGYIDVESTPEKGSIITIFLPASEQIPIESTKEQPIDTGTAKARIMIMEDEEQVRNMSQAMLTSMGHDTVLAKDGKEALALYKQAMKSGSPVDLTIMDLTIPGGMGGKEAVKKVLSLNPKAKVIVSSGYSTDPIMSSPQEYGFCGTLVKPYQRKELARVINEVLAAAEDKT